MRIYVIFGLLFFQTLSAYSQSLSSIQFIEPEVKFGKIVPTNTFIPKTHIQQRFGLNIGKLNLGGNDSWQSFYNYPNTGITLEYAKLGLDSMFGNAVSVLPYIEFRLGQKIPKSFSFHVGLGASYFDTPFDSIKNPTNKAVGSHVTWAFQLFGYQNIYTNNRLILRLGGGYMHNSNGHTKLPNFGLNSAALSLSAQFLHAQSEVSILEELPNHPSNLSRNFGLEFRQGLGFQAFGGTAAPIGGNIRQVFSSELSVSVFFRRYFKFYGGFAFRYYQNFYDYLIENQINKLSNRPKLNASSFYFFLGTEFLIGHVGLDIQGGLTIFKPFYKKFDSVYQHSKPFDYWLKYLFPSRMGLKFYLFNTQYLPKNNVWIGAHIAANFGEADFTEISFGFVHILK